MSVRLSDSGLCRDCEYCRMHGIRFTDVNRAFEARCRLLEREIRHVSGGNKDWNKVTAHINQAAHTVFPDGDADAVFKDWDRHNLISADCVHQKIRLWGADRWPFFDSDPVCAGRRVIPISADEKGSGLAEQYPTLPLKDVLFGRVGRGRFKSVSAADELIPTI